MTESAFAIVSYDHGVDGRAPRRQVIKAVYEDESEAARHCFAPFEIAPIEYDLNDELDKLAARVTPVQGFIMSQYKGGAIASHLQGLSSLSPRPDGTGKPYSPGLRRSTF